MIQNHHQKNPVLIPLLMTFLLLSFFFMCSHSAEHAKKTGQNQFLKQTFDFGGEIIFHSNFDGDNEIYKLSKQGVEKLTDNSWDDEYPVWAIDKSKIAFTANPEGNYNIYTMTPQGTQITQITTAKTDDKDPSWFPDGRHIAYSKERKKSSAGKRFSLKLTSSRKKQREFCPITARHMLSPTSHPLFSLSLLRGSV